MLKRNYLSAWFFIPFSFVASTALAQDESTDADQRVIEEILVTANRRGSANIMEIPQSITVLTGEDTERFALRDLNGIAAAVPGLSSGTVSAFKSSQFAMRGVSETTIILYKESPVGITLDEFVVPHIQTSNLEMFDIEAVEVLRGPQGTLFGKNTTAGVINVRTKRPVLEETSADIRLHYGDYGTKKTNLALNFGGETVAVRLAGMYLESDGYYENKNTYGPIGVVVPFNTALTGQSGVGDGRDLGGDDVFSGRAKLLWNPTDDLSLLFQYEVVRDEGDTPPIVNDSRSGYFLPLWGFPAATGDPIEHAGSTLRDDLLLNMSKGHRVDIDGFYVNGEWAFSDAYTLYFNAGNREQESRLPSSYFGNPGPISIFDATRDDDRETSQVEVRIGSNLDGRVNFTTGVFFQEDDTEFCVLQVVGLLDGFFLGTPPDFFNDNPLILCNKQDAEAKAVFIDGVYDVNDKLHITAGYRYTDEKKSWSGRPRVNVFALDGAPTLAELGDPINGADFDRFPTGVVHNSENWTESTYRLIFGYDFSETSTGFFGYSRGFKSGGYNDQLGTQLNPITQLAAQPTEPEIADSLEAGFKSSIFDGRATISLNAYYVEYTDAQRTFNVSFPGGGQETLFFNAAELTVKGVEAEGIWMANDALTLRYNVSWMDSTFDKFAADTNFDGIIDVDLSGQPVTRAPDLMASLDANYHMAIGSGRLDWDVRVSYEDDSVSSYSDVAPEFNTFLESRTLWDASVTYTDAKDRYFVRLMGSNLTDERYRTGSLSVGQLWIMSAYGAPRYYALEVGMKFMAD
ncbi:MAG: TonB-dependent receptor [bacterium]|jgi:iron complex outermembrane receptor protein|nr:TonB-dependent receptor [Gammaproteobacteria bacterium]HIL84871.1 TonB-dependent receptor [Pseudomonadales bacterium]